MKGDEFKTKVAALITGARGKMEKVITKKKVSEEKAKEIRSQFDAAVVKINAATDKAVEDGTVTKEEAESVQTVAREALPHPKHEGKGKPKK
jgi:phage I-like protein